MYSLPIVFKLSTAAFLLLWRFMALHHAAWYIGVIAALLILLLLLALRLLTWLRHSGAWTSALIRMIGALLITMLIATSIYGTGFMLAAWWGRRNITNMSLWQLDAVFERMIDPLLIGSAVGLVSGLALIYWLTRSVVPRYVAVMERRTRKTRHDGLTDARTVSELLPKPIQYDPRRYFQTGFRNEALFLGLDSNRKPVTLSKQIAHETHIQLVGPTRTGKGLIAQNLLAQSVRRGEAVVVFDPKVGADKWLPSVLHAECVTAGLQFRYVDLRADCAQFNLLKGCTPRETMELLTTGLKLGRKGEAADFYRVAERAHLRRTTMANSAEPWSIPELADALGEAAGEDQKKLEGLMELMGELADIPAVQTRAGVDLEEVLTHGGVLYIAGSDLDEDIRMLQPMLVQRLVQLIRRRPRDVGLHVTMFLDEVKHLLSTAVLNSLGMIADRNCTMIPACQSLKDLVCIDASQDTTESVVNTNCTIRFCYRQLEPRTVDWIESQTGKILINVESAEIQRNPALAEVQHETRRVQQVQRATIDTNMINQLPSGCAVLLGVGPAKLVFSSPIPVQRREFTPVTAPRVTRRRHSADALLAIDEDYVCTDGNGADQL